MGSRLSALPNVGDVVDRYRVVAEIGRGGMAALFAVRRTGSGGFDKVLAMKMMLPHLAADAHFVKMFLDEARVASRVEHRNVVQVFGVGAADGAPFLVMELLRGRSAADLASIERVPIAVALDVLAQAADGLHAAHEARDAAGAPLSIVHRDISPQNLFVCASGDVKVVDFGIAAARGRQAATRTDELKGKLSYIAPEQVTRAYPVTRSADLWSLGVVAWELFAGRRLFEPSGHEAATLWNIVEGPIEDLGRLAPDLREEARAMVHRCLARVPGERPESADEVARVLHAAASACGGGPATTASFVERTCGVALAEEAQRLQAAATAPDAPPMAVSATTPSLPSPREIAPADGTASVALPSRRRALVALTSFAVVAGAVAFLLRTSSGVARAPVAVIDAPSSPVPPSALALPSATADAAIAIAPAPSTVAEPPVATRPAHEPKRGALRPGRAPAPAPTPSKSATSPLLGNPF